MPLIELPELVVAEIDGEQAATRPVLVNRAPSPGEVGVPRETLIALELVDPGEAGIDRERTRVLVNGRPAFDGRATPELRPGFDGPLAAVTATGDTLRIVLHPTLAFRSQQTVLVEVFSATADGEGDLDESYGFEIEDRTAPRLLTAFATSSKAVRLAFDEDIVVTDPAGFSFAAETSPAMPLVAVSAVSDGSLVDLTLATEMTPGARCRVTVTGVADAHGNAILPPADTATFDGFAPPRPRGRRFDLWQMLPKWSRREDLTGDLARLIACLQEVTDLVLTDIDRFPAIYDIERAPEPFVDAILADLGSPFAFELTETEKRRLAAVLVEMYRMKGTAQGIAGALRFFLDLEDVEVVPYAAEVLTLGESELGVDWVLGPSGSFARYAFDVVVGRILTNDERAKLRAIVTWCRPAHAHLCSLVEPVPPATCDHWELGISELGETTDLH